MEKACVGRKPGRGCHCISRNPALTLPPPCPSPINSPPFLSKENLKTLARTTYFGHYLCLPASLTVPWQLSPASMSPLPMLDSAPGCPFLHPHFLTPVGSTCLPALLCRRLRVSSSISLLSLRQWDTCQQGSLTNVLPHLCSPSSMSAEPEYGLFSSGLLQSSGQDTGYGGHNNMI